MKAVRNIMDLEWEKMVRKLLRKYSRLRLTLEDEQLIKKITDKL